MVNVMFNENNVPQSKCAKITPLGGICVEGNHQVGVTKIFIRRIILHPDDIRFHSPACISQRDGH